ncbi:hypothetical protein PORY_000379 [Pneumocystis oryctolagi]|uniref:Uncharacterized protein n=1 Tax=Pneumocystis oryctolagi TaxID=42067 RepID=A0ACB7CF15_9ASCO|nr:hypothetical protein PORY_000379 [Pneumocystis oryctolagi]
MVHSNFFSSKEKKLEGKEVNDNKETSNIFSIESDFTNFNGYENRNTKKRCYNKSFEDCDVEERYFEKLLQDDIKIDKKEKSQIDIIKSNTQNNSSEKCNSYFKDDLEKTLCTIFVGNLPISVVSSKTSYKEFKTKFLEFGKIKSIRFRSIAFSEPLPRKVAYIQKKFHSKRDMLNAYIVYETKESSEKALVLNSTIFLNRHIRVDSVAHPTPHIPKKSIFIGNLSFDAQEEQLWSYFGHCGEIEFVRIVRDNKTNIGKGFAYIQFKNQESIDEALLLHDKKGPCGRKLRIVRAKNVSKKNSRLSYKEKNKYLSSKNPADIFKESILHNMHKNSFNKRNLIKLKKNLVFEGKRASKLDNIRIRNRKKKKKTLNKK